MTAPLADELDRTCRIDGCPRPADHHRMCGSHRGLAEYKPRTSRPRSAIALADEIDFVVVDRLVDGQIVPYTSWERREAVTRLRRCGHTMQAIADKIGIDKTQVYRDLKRNRSTKSSTPVHTFVHRDPLLCTPTGSPLLISVAGQQETASRDSSDDRKRPIQDSSDHDETMAS